jgi:hypothetical protein
VKWGGAQDVVEEDGAVTPGLLVQLVLATSVLTLGVMLAAVGALLPGMACCLGAGAWLARSFRRL